MADRSHPTAAGQHRYWQRFQSLAAELKTKLDKWEGPLSIEVGQRAYEDCIHEWEAVGRHWDSRPQIIDGIYRRFDDGMNVLPFDLHEAVRNAQPVIEEILVGFRFERLPAGDCWVLRQVLPEIGGNLERLVNLLEPFVAKLIPEVGNETPNDRWNFHEGEAAFRGVRFPIQGVPWRLLKELTAKPGTPVGKAALLDAVAEDGNTGEEALRSHLSRTRDILRNVFRMPRGHDPLPNVERGRDAAWKLEEKVFPSVSEIQRWLNGR